MGEQTSLPCKRTINKLCRSSTLKEVEPLNPQAGSEYSVFISKSLIWKGEEKKKQLHRGTPYKHLSHVSKVSINSVKSCWLCAPLV
jgi:hypothetical protein